MLLIRCQFRKLFFKNGLLNHFRIILITFQESSLNKIFAFYYKRCNFIVYATLYLFRNSPIVIKENGQTVCSCKQKKMKTWTCLVIKYRKMNKQFFQKRVYYSLSQSLRDSWFRPIQLLHVRNLAFKIWFIYFHLFDYLFSIFIRGGPVQLV